MSFYIGKDVKIHPSAKIDVVNGKIGDRPTICEGAVIQGHSIHIGTESYIGPFATIGGGSCYDECAYLIAGDWLHLGPNVHLNIARGIEIGHEHGSGIDTKILTHGAYIDSHSLGAPTQWGKVVIGNNVWLPNAWVNPGVSIGDNTLVAARSLVNRSIESGALAAGIPCKVIKKNYFPRKLNNNEKNELVQKIISQVFLRKEKLKKEITIKFDIENDNLILSRKRNETIFNLKTKTISGNVSKFSEILKDQLRRNGIRFRYKIFKDKYVEW